VFFYFVNQGLQGEADLDHDNQISPEELSQYAKKRVKDFVRDKYGVFQRPESVGSSRDLAALVTLKPEAARPALITTRAAGIKLKKPRKIARGAGAGTRKRPRSSKIRNSPGSTRASSRPMYTRL